MKALIITIVVHLEFKVYYPALEVHDAGYSVLKDGGRGLVALRPDQSRFTNG